MIVVFKTLKTEIMTKGIKDSGMNQGTPALLTKDLRAVLKGIIVNELGLLPDTLEKLEPEKRIDIVLKLLPYVLPKVEAVSMYENEPLGSNLYL